MMLRPWEFYEYTFVELLIAFKGFQAGEVELMKKFRIVGWAAIAPHLNNKTSPEQWMPLPGDSVQNTGLTAEDVKAFRQKYIDLGIVKSN
jgi:hypothetical protein